MAFELILLGALIFIFIISFCGLLQKIKQTYDRERFLAARLAQRREQQLRQRRSDSFTEVYINPSFVSESNGGVFPTAAPPPYSQYYTEPPPKYDDVIKVHQPYLAPAAEEDIPTENRPVANPDAAPPYTISVNATNIVNETSSPA